MLQHWSLFKKLWPFGGMYTTMAALTTDKEGAALTYAVIFAAGSLGKLPLCWRLGCILPRARAMISSRTGGVSGTGTITCEPTNLVGGGNRSILTGLAVLADMNFTAVHPNGTMDAELAAAIDSLE